MTAEASCVSTEEDLRQHPYLVSDPYRYTTSARGLIDEIDKVAAYQVQVLDMHRQRPIDALVGEDVSARTLTLVTRGLMRLAQAGGHIDTIPRTYFMASGRDYGRVDLTESEVRDWADKLREHAGDLTCKASLGNVLVITEQKGSGRSVGRIIDGFNAYGVDASDIEMAIVFSSLNGVGGSSQRQSVGVERFRPEPVSRRHPEFDSIGARQLRSFIGDYVKTLYSRIFGEDPPANELSSPRYTTEWRTRLEPGELRGVPYSRKRFGLDDA